MNDQDGGRAARDYWGRDRLDAAIFDSLASMGKDLDSLTIDDLAPFDQFHTGGKRSTVMLAKLAGLTFGMNVLDVGGGLGGPARTLAVEFGCNVTVLDLTESYVIAGEALTKRLGLDGRVRYRLGDGLAPPFDEASFDAVWTQNACMNISDKETLFAGFQRVLRPGGLLAFQEPLAGPVQPMIFPVMWAADEASNFLRTPAETQALVEKAGFRLRHWQDVTQEFMGRGTPPRHSIQYLVMGEQAETFSLNGKQNDAEGRLVDVQAVFERP